MSDSWRQPRRILMAALGGLTVFYLLAPTLVIVPMSFTEARILSFPPEGFSFQWYERMLSDRQWSSGMVNSLQTAVLTAVIATVLGTLAALGLARGRFPGRGFVNGLVLTPLIVPVVIIAIGMFGLFVQWRISGSIVGLVAAHTALALPFVVVSVSTSLLTIDRNLELAAANLGADPRRVFTRITLPIILPGVLAGAIFSFITSWDEVVIAIFLTSARFRTLPVEMWEQVRQVVDPTVAAVATTLFAVTTTLFVVLLVVRRQAPAR
ncbi:MAG TPA: ABC transporter permease [Candidatus Limnocylindrales bacterium]|nr:ABC transporter permease [Candidatus Limnocylindrales bacterium]